MNTKRILIFLAFAFGIPWAAALGISLSAMMAENPVQAQGLANMIFIFTPWLATLCARLLTREGWKNLWLRPNFKRGWRFYLAAWLLPILATLMGGAAFYLIFPQSFDPNLGEVRKLVAGTPSAAVDPWTIFLPMALSMLIATVLINTLVSMGEEFGWRAYLLPKLVERFAGSNITDGGRKAALLTGLIHGIWHWPLILMSMRFLPEVTLITPLVYLVYTSALSMLLSWCTLRSGSVWPAALGHASANAAAVLVRLLLKGTPIPLVGPEPTGFIGGIGYILLALVLLFSRGAFAGEKTEQPEAMRAAAGEKSL